MVRLKHIITTFCLIWFVSFVAHGQSRQDRFEAIENQKAAFITKHLKLTTSEAQKFFPIYNQYSREIRDLKLQKTNISSVAGSTNSFKRKTDVIEFDEKEVEVKKKYRAKFAEVVGQARASQFFSAEQEFIELLYKELNSRGNKH